MPYARFCVSCGVKHNPPTGKKCANNASYNNAGIVDLFSEVEAPTLTTEIGTMEDELKRLNEREGVMEDRITDFERRMDQRMEKLERLLVSSVSDKRDRKEDLPDSYGWVENCASDDDEDNLFPTSSKLKSKKKKATPFSHDYQVKEGESVSTLNTVTLMCVRLVRQLVDEGENPTPVLKHIEFMTKKSTLATYKHDAYVMYDKTVRDRANHEGLSAFGVVATEEVATAFCSENILSFSNKGHSSKNPSIGRKKNIRYCRSFNEGSCVFRNCQYVHACMACDEQSHGKVDCSRLKSTTSSSR